MDLSVISYLLVLPLVLLLIPGKQEWKGKLSGYYHLILAFLITLICMGNILLFHFWGGLINYRALTYLSDPQEIFAKFFSVLSGGDEYRIGDVVPGFSHSKISAHPNIRGVNNSTASQTDSFGSDVRSTDTWYPRGMANVADE